MFEYEPNEPQMYASSVSVGIGLYATPSFKRSGFKPVIVTAIPSEARSSFVERKENVIFLGPPGYGFSAKVIGESAWLGGVASQSLKLALDVHGIIRAGDNLKQVLESRTSIDVACGVLMAQNRCSYAEAFSKLAGTSRHRNLKVRSVADSILKAMPSGLPGTRFEPQAFA